MKTKIVVDSSSNLYTLSGVDFACVPLKIVTDDGEYLDTAELDAVGMAQTLRSYKGKTGTSCPNVADWLAAYEGAEEVFVVTITGTLSGSYNAAQLAAEEYRQVPACSCWTVCRPGRNAACWPSVWRHWCRQAVLLMMLPRGFWPITGTRTCCSRWNRWPTSPATAA